ncbi:hypothetical protein QZH41_011608 [Actinostola sp. cb2023]|nr:hypothetical protein QZH41_011608 [Actinostola sp. cb2023]
MEWLKSFMTGYERVNNINKEDTLTYKDVKKDLNKILQFKEIEEKTREKVTEIKEYFEKFVGLEDEETISDKKTVVTIARKYGEKMEEYSEDSKEDMKTKQRTIGRKKFNLHPDKLYGWFCLQGIEYLVSNALLNETPEDIAEYLYAGEGLNKTQIGSYLGEHKDFHLKVFEKFVKLHKFEGRNLVHALREFLWSFRLPGEAQKIDRMMEGFAKQYCQDNPGLFTHTDTCYVLSFSIILLNTSLHNPSVKDKPTIERFILMNKGLNCGADLDKDFLISLYESIKNEAFKIPEDDGNDITQTFFNPDREGVLVKEGGLHKTWRKRYFILKDNCLYYFKNVGDREPRGIIPLENLQVREVNDAKRKYCFEIYSADNSSGLIKACKTDSEGKVVEGTYFSIDTYIHVPNCHHDVYRICAASEEERETWIGCIK